MQRKLGSLVHKQEKKSLPSSIDMLAFLNEIELVAFVVHCGWTT